MDLTPLEASLCTLVAVFHKYKGSNEKLTKVQFVKLLAEQITHIPKVRIYDKFFQSYFTNVVSCQL